MPLVEDNNERFSLLICIQSFEKMQSVEQGAVIKSKQQEEHMAQQLRALQKVHVPGIHVRTVGPLYSGTSLVSSFQGFY